MNKWWQWLVVSLAVWTLGATAPVRADITTGLVAYYPFTGNVNDASGNSNNGTLFGTATFTNTPAGDGLDFTGQVAHHLDLGTWFSYTNFTIGMWVYPRAVTPPAVLIDDNYSEDNNWVCQSLDGTNYDFSGASFTMPTDQWSYVVLTALSTGLEVYVNGQLTGSNPVKVINYLNPPSLWVGARALDDPADPRFWNGIIANLRLYNRALATNDITQLYASEAASHSLFSWTRLCTSNQIPAQFYPTAAGVDYTNGIVYSVAKSTGRPGALIAYNLASNTFITLPARNWPGQLHTAVYDSTSQRILAWLDGRGTVYAIPTTGGVWQSLGGGALTTTDFSNSIWWNPLTGRINTFGGYGGYTFRNWLWDFNPANGTWTQLQTNNPGVVGRPWPRENGVNSIAPDPAGTRLFLWGGSGTSNGVQYALDSGFYGWDNDGLYNGYSSELYQDLWSFNYATTNWSNLVPVSSHTPQLMGSIVYHPATASILLLGGQYPPANTENYSSQVYQLRVGRDTSFAPLAVAGDPPATFRRRHFFPVAVLDAPRSRAVIFTDDGVHALTPSTLTPATITVVANPVGGGTVHGSGTYAVGSIQSISATPGSFWNFTGWSDGNTNTTRSITVALSGAKYTANFKFQTAVITVLANPTNGGTVSGGGTYPVFSSQQIAPNPTNGWMFTGWSDGTTKNPRTISVLPTNATYTANFTNALATVQTPTITPAGGTFTNGVLVTLSCATTGATIHYTTNGIAPTSLSTVYLKKAFLLTRTTTLQAKAFKINLADSATTNALLTIIIPPAPTIATSSLPIATTNQQYTATLAVTAGTGVAPFQWFWSAPNGFTLPAGLAINKKTGIISGKPTTAGVFTITVQAMDARLQTGTRTLILQVN